MAKKAEKENLPTHASVEPDVASVEPVAEPDAALVESADVQPAPAVAAGPVEISPGVVQLTAPTGTVITCSPELAARLQTQGYQ